LGSAREAIQGAVRFAPRRERRTLPVSFVIVFRGGNCDGESGARAAMVPSAVDETTMFRSTRRDFFVRASSCLSVKSKAVSNRRRLKEVTRSFFPFANALSRSRRYFREEFPGQIGFFKGAFFSRFEMPTAVVFSRLSSVGVFSCQESRVATPSHLVSRV
jgi:hypothetical protein